MDRQGPLARLSRANKVDQLHVPRCLQLFIERRSRLVPLKIRDILRPFDTPLLHRRALRHHPFLAALKYPKFLFNISNIIFRKFQLILIKIIGLKFIKGIHVFEVLFDHFIVFLAHVLFCDVVFVSGYLLVCFGMRL